MEVEISSKLKFTLATKEPRFDLEISSSGVYVPDYCKTSVYQYELGIASHNFFPLLDKQSVTFEHSLLSSIHFPFEGRDTWLSGLPIPSPE